ncbi:MAG: hypothetical protein LBO64_07920 [Desulfovibrio sp.]|jgi:glycosyltransferase involved in cell wall biosynthesis|nr:hypothetical protein [Desulfovibrio sp.]
MILKRMLPEKLKRRLRPLLGGACKDMPYQDVMIKDYYKTHRKKRILVSYIVEPFLETDWSFHTNRQEVSAIAEVFHSLGYGVDVVPYYYRKPLDYSRYTAVFGFDAPLCHSFTQNDPEPCRIYYGTGMPGYSNNLATMRRAIEVYKERGVWLIDSCRIVREDWPEQTTLVDAMITLGNHTTKEAYRIRYNGPIFTQRAIFNAAVNEEELRGKKFSEAKKHFLWFGSSGAVHKGLDLLLRIFADKPEKILHIAGPVLNEKAFMRAFSQELAKPNIVMHGFVNVRSPEFVTLMRQCAFTVLPPCAEANATSLLNTMCNGLLPVMKPVCGIDFSPYTVRIEEPDIESVRVALECCYALSAEELATLSRDCLVATRRTYSLDAFRTQLEQNLRKILKETEADSCISARC